MPPLKFKVKLEGADNMETAVFHPPFDAEKVFGTRGRVPVKGTINKAPFRSSLMNMGTGHCMVVNRQLRDAARCKAGDTVDVVMERDTEKRVMKVPKYLKEIIGADPKIAFIWEKLSYTHQKEYVQWVEDAKKPETRQRRIEKMMAVLRERAKK